MFFKRKYNYNKYIKDLNSVFYRKNTMQQVLSFPENEVDKPSFFISHYGLINSHVIRYFNLFPEELTGKSIEQHVYVLENIYIDVMIAFGLYQDSPADRTRASVIFHRSVDNWDNVDIIPEAIDELGLMITNASNMNPIAASTYRLLLQDAVLHNVKCVGKLIGK